MDLLSEGFYGCGEQLFLLVLSTGQKALFSVFGIEGETGDPRMYGCKITGHCIWQYMYSVQFRIQTVPVLVPFCRITPQLQNLISYPIAPRCNVLRVPSMYKYSYCATAKCAFTS